MDSSTGKYNGTAVELATADVQFVKELYPRLREDDAAIERYRASIDRLPPIVVARGNVLVDGFHRWQAYRRENLPTIQAVDLGNLTDAQIIRESIERNATHGQQLSQSDKQRLAGILWPRFAHLANGERVAELAGLLSVTDRTVRAWTQDARKAEEQEQKARVLDLWLDCRTQEQIAEETGIPRKTVSNWLGQNGSLSEMATPPASLQTFDVWKFATTDAPKGFFGAMPPQILENLLWLYTEPGQVVFDPFAGSGTTIEVAKRMGRRVWSSDLSPSTPTLPIHQHDIAAGWPADAPRKVDFIMLDPPYWQQAKGRYSDKAEDLGNLDLETFRATWARLVTVCREHLSPTGRMAFIIGPTEADGAVVDHALECAVACLTAGYTIERRIVVPYNTQQATGQQVQWAKDNRRLLKLYRDVVVCR